MVAVWGMYRLHGSSLRGMYRLHGSSLGGCGSSFTRLRYVVNEVHILIPTQKPPALAEKVLTQHTTTTKRGL